MFCKIAHNIYVNPVLIWKIKYLDESIQNKEFIENNYFMLKKILLARVLYIKKTY